MSTLAEEHHLWIGGQLYVVQRRGQPAGKQLGPALDTDAARWLAQWSERENLVLREVIEHGDDFEIRPLMLRSYSPERSQLATPAHSITEHSENEVEDDWIEFRLEDETGKPLAGVRYILTLPNGSKRPGLTTASGVVYHEGIPSGECEICLTDIDESEWKVQ